MYAHSDMEYRMEFVLQMTQINIISLSKNELQICLSKIALIKVIHYFSYLAPITASKEPASTFPLTAGKKTIQVGKNYKKGEINQPVNPSIVKMLDYTMTTNLLIYTRKVASPKTFPTLRTLLH